MFGPENVSQVLGLEYVDYPHVNEAILFMYLLKLAQEADGKTENYVHATLLLALRAFGSDGLVVPVVFGMPHTASPYYYKMDFYISLIVTAVFAVQFVFPRFISNNLTAQVWGRVQQVFSLAYSIIKGNAAAAGYALAATACGTGASCWGSYCWGTSVAPMLGAFLAVNGHVLLENGIKGAAEEHGKYSADFLTGVAAGPIIYYLTHVVLMDPLHVRCAVVAFHASTNYVGYNQLLTDGCAKLVASVKDIKMDFSAPATAAAADPKKK